MSGTRLERLRQGPAPINAGRKEQFVIEHRLRLLTYVFGGGAESKQSGDPVTPVRGSALRGQLRFWWRACRGGQFRDLAQLKQAEDALWGAASKPGVVNLEVDASSLIRKEIPLFEKQGRAHKEFRDLAYVGFPLQGTNDSPPWPAVQYSGQFTVRVRIASTAEDEQRRGVEAAVWAWLHFGGVGGRTRRGFGAVSLPEGREQLRAVTADLLSNDHVSDARPPAGIPSLAPSAGASLVVLSASMGAEDQWRMLARRYRDFRQGRGLGRNPPQPRKHAGRSRWPEPDLIRHGTGPRNKGALQHQERIVSVDKAPRAAFGMPVIFHFQKEEGIKDDLTLKLKEAERYASPLILRPVGHPDQARAVALVLGNRPDLDRLQGGTVLEQAKASPVPVSTRLSAEEAGWPKSPLAGEPDPLIAFLNHLRASNGQ